MKRIKQASTTLTVLSCVAIAASVSLASAQTTGYTGIFGGGPFYKNAGSNITEIENSGFTEAIVWSVEVNAAGDLNLNGEFPLTANGVYIGAQTHPDFASNMAQLKLGTVKRVTFSVGSSNFGDWENIKALVDAQGTGPSSILYKDFQALKAAIPALDAIDLDDENSYDAPSTVAFGVMLGSLGLKAIPDPYTNNSYWETVVSQINAKLPGTVDGVHLQAYAGGAGNNPCVGWNFGAVPVWPGLWDQNYTPSQVQSIMSGWNSQCGISGGFLWLYDDIVGTGAVNLYAAAINNAVGAGAFTLSGPHEVFLDQSGAAAASIQITDRNGFTGSVTLSIPTLPRGVQAKVQGTGNQQTVVFHAGASAPTGTTTVSVIGTSGKLSQTLTLTLAVSAAVGSTGTGVQVDLSPLFNLYGIYTDTTMYTTGGIDGQGNSYSEHLLSTSRILNGVQFKLGAANQPDAIGCGGQSLALPSGSYSDLILLAAAVNGNQPSQVFTVNYTDGTSTKLTQSISDWYTPQTYPGQGYAVVMPYRNTAAGTKDARVFNLYSYRFALNQSKSVLNITLPANPSLVVLSATLTP